jgi:hypothetical protein
VEKEALMRFTPIGQEFVAEVTGIDLRVPLDAAAAAAIHAGMACWCSTTNR